FDTIAITQVGAFPLQQFNQRPINVAEAQQAQVHGFPSSPSKDEPPQLCIIAPSSHGVEISDQAHAINIFPV
ncbi:MAG: hypothetical protein WBW85_04700, partial [Terriglobales bacterium]